jgi:hypothetical protein
VFGNFLDSFLSGVAQPAPVELGITTTERNKFVVRTVLNQHACVEHEHKVGLFRCRQSVGNADGGAAFGEPM